MHVCAYMCVCAFISVCVCVHWLIWLRRASLGKIRIFVCERVCVLLVWRAGNYEFCLWSHPMSRNFDPIVCIFFQDAFVHIFLCLYLCVYLYTCVCVCVSVFELGRRLHRRGRIMRAHWRQTIIKSPGGRRWVSDPPVILLSSPSQQTNRRTGGKEIRITNKARKMFGRYILEEI